MELYVGNIVQEGHPALRKKAARVSLPEVSSPHIQKVLKALGTELGKCEDGVAIAAPQIGESLRIFVISKKVFATDKEGTPLDPSEISSRTDIILPSKDMVFINPIITKLSRTKHWTPEGCLSVRHLYGETRRSDKATIEAYDEFGKKFSRGGSGLLAQIFQHEVDHLDGILFIDHARNLEDLKPEMLEEARTKRKLLLQKKHE